MGIKDVFKANNNDLADLSDFILRGQKPGPDFQHSLRSFLEGPYLEMLNPALARIEAALKPMRAEREQISDKLKDNLDLLAKYEDDCAAAERDIQAVEDSLPSCLKEGKAPNDLRERLRQFEGKRADAQLLAKALRDSVIPELETALSGLDGAMLKAQAEIIDAVISESHKKMGELAVEIFIKWQACGAARSKLMNQGGIPHDLVKQVHLPVEWDLGAKEPTGLGIPSWAVEGKPWQP